jgi:hypothetical protein
MAVETSTIMEVASTTADEATDGAQTSLYIACITRQILTTEQQIVPSIWSPKKDDPKLQ